MRACTGVPTNSTQAKPYRLLMYLSFTKFSFAWERRFLSDGITNLELPHRHSIPVQDIVRVALPPLASGYIFSILPDVHHRPPEVDLHLTQRKAKFTRHRRETPSPKGTRPPKDTIKGQGSRHATGEVGKGEEGYLIVVLLCYVFRRPNFPFSLTKR